MEAKHKDDNKYEVEVNGQGIDLAYVYIEKNGKWVNLAMELGLKVSQVPKYLPALKKHAPKEKRNAIDINEILEECIEKDSSTAGMTNCTYKAYEQWDDELNKVYKQLRDVLNPEAKNKLKEAQTKWIKYRDSEFELINSIYSSLEGTVYIPMRVSDRVDIVKKRAMEFGSYPDLIENK